MNGFGSTAGAIMIETTNKLSEGLPCVKELSMAKGWVSDAYYRICVSGHQIHGGTSFTENHNMGLYFRRAKAQKLTSGNADFHRVVVATEIGLI